jgi:hypothetical protein
MLPLKECCLLPIAQCSAEELAEYLATEALKELSSRKGGAIQCHGAELKEKKL